MDYFVVLIRKGRNLSMSCEEHEIIFTCCTKVCESSPQFSMLKAVAAFLKPLLIRRFQLTKLS